MVGWFGQVLVGEAEGPSVRGINCRARAMKELVYRSADLLPDNFPLPLHHRGEEGRIGRDCPAAIRAIHGGTRTCASQNGA